MQDCRSTLHMTEFLFFCTLVPPGRIARAVQCDTSVTFHIRASFRQERVRTSRVSRVSSCELCCASLNGNALLLFITG